MFTMLRSRCSRCPILAFTMGRSSRSRWAETRNARHGPPPPEERATARTGDGTTHPADRHMRVFFDRRGADTPPPRLALGGHDAILTTLSRRPRARWPVLTRRRMAVLGYRWALSHRCAPQFKARRSPAGCPRPGPRTLSRARRTRRRSARRGIGRGRLRPPHRCRRDSRRCARPRRCLRRIRRFG